MSGNQQGVVLVVSALFIIVPVFFLVACLCSVFWPRTMWFLSEGWKFKNVEPSGCALAATRVGGLVGFLVGIVFLFILWSLGGNAGHSVGAPKSPVPTIERSNPQGETDFKTL